MGRNPQRVPSSEAESRPGPEDDLGRGRSPARPPAAVCGEPEGAERGVGAARERLSLWVWHSGLHPQGSSVCRRDSHCTPGLWHLRKDNGTLDRRAVVRLLSCGKPRRGCVVAFLSSERGLGQRMKCVRAGWRAWAGRPVMPLQPPLSVTLICTRNDAVPLCLVTRRPGRSQVSSATRTRAAGGGVTGVDTSRGKQWCISGGRYVGWEKPRSPGSCCASRVYGPSPVSCREVSSWSRGSSAHHLWRSCTGVNQQPRPRGP